MSLFHFYSLEISSLYAELSSVILVYFLSIYIVNLCLILKASQFQQMSKESFSSKVLPFLLTFSWQAGSEGHSDVSSMFEERLEAAEIASGLKPEPSEDQLDQILDTVLKKQSTNEEETNGGPKSPGILQQVLPPCPDFLQNK